MRIESSGNTTDPKRITEAQSKSTTRKVRGKTSDEETAPQRGIVRQAGEIYETFGVDKALRGAKVRDLVKQSGNLLERGIIHNVQLKGDSISTEATRRAQKGTESVLAQWKEVPTDDPRKIVMDYSKTPGEQKSEQKQMQGVDLEG